MNCPLRSEETRVMLLDYSAERLDPAIQAALEKHMAGCTACAEAVGQQRVVWDALDSWEPTPVSAEFNRRLWQRIDAAAAQPWYVRLAGWKPAIPVAAIAMVMMVGSFMMQSRQTFPRRGVEVTDVSMPADGVSMMDAAQVEATLDDLQLLRQLDTVTLPGGSVPDRI
jgi:anti-sigma factor RsiW